MGKLTSNESITSDPLISKPLTYDDAVRMISNCHICDVPCNSSEALEIYNDVKDLLRDLLCNPSNVKTAVEMLSREGLNAFYAYHKQHKPFKEQ